MGRMKDDIIMQPVGFVKNAISDKNHYGWKDIFSEILVEEEYLSALDGLGDFSHIIVLFWLHLVTADERAIRKARPQRKAEIPELGIFAWHSSRRPNPIGMSIVKLVDLRGNRLEVQGLDAIDSTPVLDLRPYVESYYHVDRSEEPGWVTKTRTRRCQ